MGENKFKNNHDVHISVVGCFSFFKLLSCVNFAEFSSESRVPRNTFSETLDWTIWSFAPKTNKLLMNCSLVQTRGWYAEK